MKARRFYSPTVSENQSAGLPLGEDVLEGLQFGGKRDYGYGTVQLKDAQMVDRSELDCSPLEGAETDLIELVTPCLCCSRSTRTPTTALSRGGEPRTATTCG